MRSRYYVPANHRFINADTFASTDETNAVACNMFAYCENNPILGYDPYGECNWGGVLAGVGIAAVGIVGALLTVSTCGAATPLVAAGVAAVGTAFSTATIGTGIVTSVAAAKESVMAVDFSFTDGSNHTKQGYSLVVDFGTNSAETYYHYGAATSSSYSASYGFGFVHNYKKPWDYGGCFVDASASCRSRGFDYGIDCCFDPSFEGTAATMLTVGISSPSGTKYSISGSVDYYYPMNSYTWR